MASAHDRLTGSGTGGSGDLSDEVVHPIQPYQAVKTYLCPGCESPIDPGVGHLVVVPRDAPDLRRHWHRGCWHKELRRLGHHRR